MNDRSKEDRCLSKREAQREERRAAILTVARRHFRRDGYGGASMSAIAADLGGSKGTLWAYFPSKEELFAATLEGLVAEYAPFMMLDAAEPIQPALMRYATHFLQVMLSPEVMALHRLVIAEASRFPEIGQIFWERGPLRRHRTLADFLEVKIAQGEMRSVDVMVASAQLHHLCHYRLVMRTLWGVPMKTDTAAIEDDARTSVGLFLEGTLPRRAGASEA